jgi:hypothetical protein
MSPVPEELDPQNPNPDDSGAVRRYARGTGGRILWIVVVIILALGSGFIFVRHQKIDAQAHGRNDRARGWRDADD